MAQIDVPTLFEIILPQLLEPKQGLYTTRTKLTEASEFEVTERPSASLARARENIEKHGWFQGALGNEELGLCLMGAVFYGVGGVRADALKYLATAIGVPLRELDAWNDDPTRTADQVLEALATAEKLALEAGQ